MSRIRVTGIGDESLLTSLLRASFNQGCQSSAAICYLSIVVAFGHNELGRSKAANRVSVTSQMLWPSATTNSGGRRPQNWLLSWLKYRHLAILVL